VQITSQIERQDSYLYNRTSKEREIAGKKTQQHNTDVFMYYIFDNLICCQYSHLKVLKINSMANNMQNEFKVTRTFNTISSIHKTQIL